MNDQATPAKVRLTDGLGPLVDAEMAAYYEGEYIDHDDAKERLWAFAAAVQAAERERCVKLCRRMRSLDGDFLARAIEDESRVNWTKRA